MDKGRIVAWVCVLFITKTAQVLFSIITVWTKIAGYLTGGKHRSWPGTDGARIMSCVLDGRLLP